MYYLYVSLLVLLLIVSFFILVIKRKNKTSLQGSQKQASLIFLNETLKELKNPTNEYKMNKEEVKQIKNEIEVILEQTFNGQISSETLEKKINEIKISVHNIKDKTKKDFDRKDELIKKINYEVGRFKTFLNTNVFYPKDYVFVANRLQGKVIDLQEAKPEKLVKLMIEVEEELSQFQINLKDFFKLHNKLKVFIANTPELTGNSKQEIYFLIQNGKLEEAEVLMNSFIKGENEKQFEEDLKR